jgi:hypothetical protein
VVQKSMQIEEARISLQDAALEYQNQIAMERRSLTAAEKELRKELFRLMEQAIPSESELKRRIGMSRNIGLSNDKLELSELSKALREAIARLTVARQGTLSKRLISAWEHADPASAAHDAGQFASKLGEIELGVKKIKEQKIEDESVPELIYEIFNLYDAVQDALSQ